MAFMADKDIRSAAENINNAYPGAKVYTATVLGNPRAESAAKLAEILTSCGLDAIAADDIKSAVSLARAAAPLTVICCSLDLYKDFSETFRN